MKATLSRGTSAILLAVSLLPIPVLLYGDGATSLWRRDYYIQVAVQDGGLRGLAGQLAIGAVLAAGFLARSLEASHVSLLWPPLPRIS